MSRGVKAPFKSYEGRKYKDKHIRLTNDMMQHDMFKSLQYTSQVLYLYMKLFL